MELGRPTLYSEVMVAKAKEYLASCHDEEIEKGTEDRPVYGLKVKLPTKGGLAIYLGVSRDTLYEWAKDYKDFSDIMEAVGAEQEDKLINNGLSGSYNSTIAKVLLTKHGYRDATDSDLTSGGKAIQVTRINFDDYNPEQPKAE